MTLIRSLFPHAKAVRYFLLGFVLAALATWATLARSETAAFEAGAQYLRGPAAAIVLNLAYPGPGDATIEPGMFLVGRRPDGALGVMGGQVLLVDGFGKLDIGIGIAYMNRTHEQLGSQVNFALMVRYRFTPRWYVAVRHWSNSGTTVENTGLDIITVGYNFK